MFIRPLGWQYMNIMLFLKCGYITVSHFIFLVRVIDQRYEG